MSTANSAGPEFDAPLVSVGIPTYNRPAGLQRTLQCLVDQTYNNLEIHVSDNCSDTPETEKIVREWQSRDPRIFYHRQPHNRGWDANFKSVLEKARGPFFFWAADDDEWHPDFVAECLAAIGDAGSVMTGMYSAVRDPGLLRWKPPVRITSESSHFDNAVAYLTNMQPSLIYGIHRTETLRVFLREFMYDYYDCFFVFRQILTHGFRIVPRVCFHDGVESALPVYKPARPRHGSIYEYWPFLRDALSTTILTAKLTFVEKFRLCFLLMYVGANEFTHFEMTTQPKRVKLLTLAKRLMRAAAPLLRVPLPPAPPAMVLPDNPADLCTMFIPRADLQSEDNVRRRIDDARRQLDEKMAVIRNLEDELDRHRAALLARPLLGRLVRFVRNISTRTKPMQGSSIENAPASSASGTFSLARGQEELGRLLLQLEDKEAAIQHLAAHLQFFVRRNARLAFFGKLAHPSTWIASLATIRHAIRRVIIQASVKQVFQVSGLFWLRKVAAAVLAYANRDPHSRTAQHGLPPAQVFVPGFRGFRGRRPSQAQAGAEAPDLPIVRIAEKQGRRGNNWKNAAIVGNGARPSPGDRPRRSPNRT